METNDILDNEIKDSFEFVAGIGCQGCYFVHGTEERCPIDGFCQAGPYGGYRLKSKKEV